MSHNASFDLLESADGSTKKLATPPPRCSGELFRQCLAEFMGTFTLCSTVALAAGQGENLMAAAGMAIGFVLATQVFAFGHVSGAHLNPAVTLAVLLRAKIMVFQACCYVVTQLVASFLAGFVIKGIVNDVNDTSKIMSGYPAPAMNVNWVSVLFVEFFFTMVLCSVVLNVATTKAQENNSFFGLAIGLTIAGAAMCGGGISGGAYNPAVGTGLPIVYGKTEWVWAYWVGPCLGAAAAAGLFRLTADASEF
jgi:aquaporin Z